MVMDNKRNIDFDSFWETVAEFVDHKDKELIHKAFDMAVELCGDKKTITGEYQLTHSTSVAKVVAKDMGLHTNSIITSLLHYPYISMNEATRKEEINSLFGPAVLNILEGLARISNINSMQSTYQAESFRKLLLSLADDVRVILIKLIERLDNMRHLDNLSENEILPYVSESYFLYAPLAHRLGYYNIKSEMEDIAIKYIEPEQYEYITKRLEETASMRDKFIKEFTEPLEAELLKHNFKFHIKSRTKSIHSILQKMRKQGIPFEEVYDLFAIRIILDSKREDEKSDCWRTYSIVTDLYQPNPSRLRDWISIPKTNGYESLHTTVIGPGGRWVEVQIRTERMDEVAEKGLAAHFKYKGVKGEGGLETWLSKMRDLLESTDQEDKSFLDQVRSGLYSDEIFVFTPKGDLRQLPAGSTVLDFAFDIHSNLGKACVGAKVNGKNVTIKHVLCSGDHVDIIKSKVQKPKQDWLSFVVTNKAKTKIKQALNEEKVKSADEGKEILLRRIKNWKIPYDDLINQKLMSHYNIKIAQDFYALIAEGKIDLLEIKEVLTTIVSGERETQQAATTPVLENKETPTKQSDTDNKYNDCLIIENKVENLDYHLAKCCNPVFGDAIFGFVSINGGIKIHRKGCSNAKFLMSRFPYRVIAAQWTESVNMPSFVTSIKINGVNEVGITNKIGEILAEFNISVRSMNYNTNEGLFEETIQISVSNNDVLYGAMRKIQTIKGILKVVRLDNIRS